MSVESDKLIFAEILFLRPLFLTVKPKIVMIYKLTHIKAKQSLWHICFFLVLFQLHVFGQNGEIRDCNDKDIITQVMVRSSNNQQLTLTNCIYTQGKLSEYLNCIKNNNPSLPATSSLVVTLTADPASGISGADLSLLKQEVLQINNITNTCNRVGSDPDLNNKLNTIDLCLIRKHNLGISNISPAWKFYKSQNLSLTGIGANTDLVFPITDFPLSNLNIVGVHNGNVNQVTTSMDTCVLLCKPDLRITPGQDEVRKLTTDYFLLNKSCNFPNLSLQILNAAGQNIGNDITQNMVGSQLTAQLRIGNTSQSCTTKLTVFSCEVNVNIDVDQTNTTDSSFVDVSVRNAENIAGYQLSLNFDTTNIQFVRIEKGSDAGFNVANDAHFNGKGHVNFSRFNESQTLGLANGTRLFRIKFKRKSSTVNNVTVDPGNVETLFFDSNKNEYCTDITYIKDTNPPVCLQDTILIQASLAIGYGIVKFTDYASDDFGTVFFESGVNEFDSPISNVDTFDCGTNILTYVTFRDSNGQSKQCIYRVIVECPETCSNKFLYFDGINDRINISNQYTGNVEFTIECWFKSDNTMDGGTADFHRIFTLGGSPRLEIGDRKGRIQIFNGNQFTIGPNIRDGLWHHLTLQRKNNFLGIFLDGNPISQGITSNTVDLRNIRVGYFDNNNIQPPTLWKGGIDEIKLWNYALSQVEINNSKNKISTLKKDCGLIGYWRMEEGTPGENNQSITTIRDSVGNNNGTLVGFNLTGDVSNFLCNDSLIFEIDNEACCQSSFTFSTNCNRINLSGMAEGFSTPSSIKFKWSSPNSSFKSMAKDTIFNYTGDRTSIIVCLEASDGVCTSTFCDTIAISPPSPPIFQNCPSSVSLSILDKCETSLNLGLPIAIDPCTTIDAIVDCVRSDGKPINSNFELGKTTVTCTALSVLGSTYNSICQYTIEILEETPPICRAKNAIVYLDNNGIGTLSPNLINNGSSDVCSDVTLSILGNQFYNCIQIGTEARVLIVTDMSGNSSSCQSFVEVRDTIRPICNSKTLNKIIGDNGSVIINPTELNNNSTDNCGNVTFTASKTIFNCADELTSNLVTLTVTDQSGNSSSCPVEVKLTDPNNYCACLNDLTKPICKTKNISLFLDATGKANLIPAMINDGSFDACTDVTLQIEGPQSFDCNTLGKQTVNLVVTDVAKNVSFCTAEVTVRDTIKPTCTMQSKTFYLGTNGQVSVSKSELSLSLADNCTGSTSTLSQTSYTCSDIGVKNIMASVMDAAGNTNTCSAQITIRDTIRPTCSMPPQTIYLGTNGQASLSQNQLNIVANDNCAGATTTFSTLNFNCSNLGMMNISATVRDIAGNTNTCTTQITVRDTIRPICIIKDTMVTAMDGIGAMVNFTGRATDNCAEGLTFSYSQPSGQFYPCGEYNIMMTARDNSGNISTCPFKLIVKDCDGCCRSESSFMSVTNQDFDLVIDLINANECIIEFKAPLLTECQKITEISWGDGTVSRGKFSNESDFLHQYIEAGLYEACVVYEESNTGKCFTNKKCQTYEVLKDCTLKRSISSANLNNIRLFPNPTNEKFYISVPGLFSEYYVYDRLGRLHKKGAISAEGIDISELNNGIYFVRLTVGSESISKPIIKL